MAGPRAEKRPRMPRDLNLEATILEVGALPPIILIIGIINSPLQMKVDVCRMVALGASPQSILDWFHEGMSKPTFILTSINISP